MPRSPTRKDQLLWTRPNLYLGISIMYCAVNYQSITFPRIFHRISNTRIFRHPIKKKEYSRKWRRITRIKIYLSKQFFAPATYYSRFFFNMIPGGGTFEGLDENILATQICRCMITCQSKGSTHFLVVNSLFQVRMSEALPEMATKLLEHLHGWLPSKRFGKATQQLKAINQS